MKAALVVIGGFIGLVVLAALIAVTAYVGANDYAAGAEAQLRAARDDNKNILAQYQQKVLEAVQVPEMYKNDLKEVISADVQGRYGPEGSKATVQFLKEHAVNFDAGLYKTITEIIQGGRKDFEIGQTRMIDIRRSYETQLGYAWRGFWLRLAGFPKINLADYAPITTEGVETTYKNGKEAGPLKLR